MGVASLMAFSVHKCSCNKLSNIPPVIYGVLQEEVSTIISILAMTLNVWFLLLGS